MPPIPNNPILPLAMKLSRLCYVLFLVPLMSLSAENTRTLYEFEDSDDGPKWLVENDDVMGGVSIGKGEIKDGSLHFSGKISLENNGGFASLQTADGDWDLHAFTRVVLRVKGDGRTYQFRMATNAKDRGSRIDYQGKFDTKADEFIEVSVPFSKMFPTWRGKTLDGPDLKLDNVRQLRVFLGDGKAGPFELIVDWIKAER